MGLLIKTLLKIFFAICILAGLSWSALEIGGRIFLADVVGVHGMALLGVPFSVPTPDIDYRTKLITWTGWEIVNPDEPNAGYPIVSVSSISVQLPLEFMPDWSFTGLIPSPVHIKAIILDGVTLSYDIDAEAETLNVLKRRISVAAETAMRDRLNAVAKDEKLNQLFVIDKVILSGVAIDAYSRLAPGKAQRFSIGSISVSGLGVEEQGLHAAEIVDRVTRPLMDEVRQEALSHGLIEVKPIIVPTKKSVRRKSDSVPDENNDGEVKEVKNEDSGAKKAVKAVGLGIKKVGQSIGHGFRKLFN